MLTGIATSLVLLGALFALPVNETGIQSNTVVLNTADAQSVATHTISMTAETLPNGQSAYKMVSHDIDGSPSGTSYSDLATIPGPTLVVNSGDTVTVTLENNIDAKSVGFQVPGLSNSNAKASTGASKTFTFTAGDAGTYLYQNKDDALLGLYGAIIVNPASGSIGKYVAEGTGNLIAVGSPEDLDKEYVLFMVGSTFWGQEISGGEQTPLWTNPVLGIDEEDLVRFHVVAVGDPHTFHLHAHRWVESTTSDHIIDTKLLLDGARHTFIVKAGADVGPGHWQYHCHVFAHMEAGMHGIFAVGGEVPATENVPDMTVDGESVVGANPHNGHALLHGDDVAPGLVTFNIRDEPGRWFESARGDGLAPITVTKSLELARPGDSVNFVMGDTDTVHTITSLLWPTGAEHMPFDQNTAYRGGGIVELTEPGLYVFTCKVHPYMFGAVIVDDPETEIEFGDEGDLFGTEVLGKDSGDFILLDLGQTLTLVNGLEIPTASDLALRLAKTFFVATAPENWRDYTETTWNPSYPPVPVKASVWIGDDNYADVAVANLDVLLEAYFAEGSVSNVLIDPTVTGVGEVWVDAQFEKTASKTKPGTATAVDVQDWTVSKKVALPEVNMNNPHNMWTSHDQTVIYQTEWFSNNLSTFDRESGALVSQIKVGAAPAHVMTRVDTGDIHVSLNGEIGVAEIFATTSPAEVDRIIATQGYGEDPTHPHAHWMSSDGQKMVTPNTFTHDTTLYDFGTDSIKARESTGVLAIATGMMPDDSYYVVANLLSSTISVIDLDTGLKVRDINLLGDYNPAILVGFNDDGGALGTNLGVLATTDVAALPIQTPISPDGKYIVTANTLTGNVIVTDVSDADPDNWFIAANLECDPGCHGVQFGAKQDGGYLAYVSSKFANNLIVIDIDDTSDTHLEIVGRVLLNPVGGMAVYDDTVTGLAGMGGQGVMPIPNVYNGWVQELPSDWKEQLTLEQQNPIQ